MLAIKQAKPKTPNKTQENQIKNTTTNTTLSNAGTHIASQQSDAALNHINIKDSPNKIEVKGDDRLQRFPARGMLENLQHHTAENQQPKHQQTTNATRSETSKTNGDTNARAASAKLLSQPPQSSPSQLPPTNPTASSLSPLVTSIGIRQPAPTASLINASVKIQQRQQKFLAAAAKSAAPTPFHSNQSPMLSKQAAVRIKTACANSGLSRTSNATTSTINAGHSRTRTPIIKPSLYSQPTMPILSTTSGACGGQAVDCCPFAQDTVSRAMSDTTVTGGIGSSVVVNVCDLQKQHSQSNNIGYKKQTMPQQPPKEQPTSLLSPPSNSDTLAGPPRTKVLSMAIMMSGGGGSSSSGKNGELGKINSASNDSFRGVNRKQDSDNKSLSSNNDHDRPMMMDCALVISKAKNATDAAAVASAAINSESSCSGALTMARAATAAGGTAAAINVDDINREAVARPLSNSSDANKSSKEDHKSCLPNQSEVRLVEDEQHRDNDANINIKTNNNTLTKQNNHNYHHYNHNHMNLHQNNQQHTHHHHLFHHHNHQNHPHNNAQNHHPEPQQQPNYLHLQYQHQHQHQQAHTTTQPQHVMMAHYKFHNDCQSSVLTYEQVERLDHVMDQTVPIFGRGASPILSVKLKELIRLVKYKLQHEHSIEIRDVILNGGVASYVLAPDNSHYNDLDLIFGTDLSDEGRFDVIRDVVLECLMEFYPKAPNDAQQKQGVGRNQIQATASTKFQMPPNNCAIKEAYVHKMVKVNDDDRWSLISLGVQQSETNFNQQHQPEVPPLGSQKAGVKQQTNADGGFGQSAGCIDQSLAATTTFQRDINGRYPVARQHQKQFPNSIELKFVDRMRRKFEFSVDSFQIILDSLIQFYDYAPQSTISIQRRSANAYPASTIINTNPLLSHVTCAKCNRGQRVLFDRKTDEDNLVCSSSKREGDNLKESNKTTQLISSYPGKKVYRHEGTQRHCDTLNASRSFHELPLKQVNSLSNSSVASSSGCSSSSSVVSSSSSSLSSDEDQEDLDRDADNSPSSSASTSSLLSSTTTSVASSTDESCSLIGSYSISSHKQQSNDNFVTDPGERRQHNLSLYSQKRMEDEHPNDDCNNPHDQIALDSEKIKTKKGDITTSKNHHDHNRHVNTRSFSENLCDFGTSKISSCAVISENFYPTVIGRSEYGNFKEALYHLEKKLIATRSPEEIRGGGLLKYCNLLVKDYKPTNVYQIRTLERYMCSRFFIDFSDLNQQRAKLESYLVNHFSDDPKQKFDYLTILHNVVHRSTVCLMNHELRLTLGMIRELAYNLNDR